MCGICGIVHADPRKRVDLSIIKSMNDALMHRGPDDEGFWNNGYAALAARRLSIIDLTGGHQPITNEDGSLIVVFNGEIYNFRSLRMELEKLGHIFKSNTDTEVIVHAWEQYGDDAVQHFNGMFAFALFDTRTQRLVLVRDRLGVKPLFYTQCNGALAFASELDALLRWKELDRAFNYAALDDYFTFLYIPAPDTAFKNIHKLRPGERLIYEHGHLKTERYWQPSYRPNRTWTLDSAAEAYRDLLTDAVSLRTISDVPLGAFLSGGIDSSSVVAILSTLSSKPVRTFTIGFDDAHHDELKFARIAARHFATEHTEEILKPDMPVVAEQLIRYFGEPFADSSAIPTWLVSQLARRDVTVALSGDGGDELFAGYTWLHRTLHVQKYRRVPTLLRQVIHKLLRCLASTPAIQQVRRFSSDSFLSPRQAFRRRETCIDVPMRSSLYSTEFKAALQKESRIDRFDEHSHDASGLELNDWMLYQDLVMYLPDDILTKVDRMSMAVSLEARTPLLDYRLVEFANSVPFHLKYQQGNSKIIPKQALRNILPQELLRQRKHGFAIPVHRWFKEDLYEVFQEVVLDNNARANSYFNPSCCKELLQYHLEGKEHYGHHLWAILMFEYWLRYLETIPTT